MRASRNGNCISQGPDFLSKGKSLKLKKTVALVLSIAGLVMAGQVDAAESQANVLTFGVVPQQAPSKLLRTWKPLLDYVQTRCDCQIVFATATDIPAFEKRLSERKYDLAYMNPYHFTVYNDTSPPYRAVARAKGKKIKGIVVARKDSGLSGLNSLSGADIAFPAPAAFAATVLPQAHMKNKGITFKPHYVSSHDSVYKAVAAGLFPAGGGVLRTFQLVDKATREKLEVIWQTPEYTPHAIAAGAWIKPSLVMKIQNALIAAAENTESEKILKPLNINGFEAAKDSDWDDVRGLSIELKLGGQ